jgi:tRNA A37 methylthiotransferase MiaB
VIRDRDGSLSTALDGIGTRLQMNVFIECSGCSRRKLDVAKLMTYFSLNGYAIVARPDKADYILITTCAFKGDEEAAAFDSLERYRTYDAKKIVYGCLADIAPRKYHENCSFDYISPKNIDLIDGLFDGIKYRFADIDDANCLTGRIKYSNLHGALGRFVSEFELSKAFFDKSRRYLRNRLFGNSDSYYLSVCRGCLGNCSYCAVRYAVGTVKSKPLDVILQEFRRGRESGNREYVLLGDDVGAYGQDIGASFPELLSVLMAELGTQTGRGTRGSTIGFHVEELNPRWLVRYSSDLIALLSGRNVKSILCPLQSGSDRILGLMQRQNTIESAIGALNQILIANRDIQLDTQIIVGFPSETEDEFEDTLQWVGTLPFHVVTLFPYDEKENTKSCELQPKVPKSVIQERIRKAQDYFRKRHISTALSCDIR